MVLPASATAEAACRNEPMASRWWNADPVTNQPAPCRDSTSPSSRSTSSARRTVGRDTAYRAQSCDSESSAPTSPNSPRAMRSRRSWAMVANRELVINL